MKESKICLICDNLIPENSDICDFCGNVYFEDVLPKEE